MNTWGASKKPRGSTSSRAGKSTSGSSRSSSASRPRGGVSDAAPAGARVNRRSTSGSSAGRRDRAQADLRQAVEGREHEFVGLFLIGLGTLLGLAIYVDLAGPLGRGVEAFVGWFFGLGRFVLPVVLVASGVALVKKGQSSSPTRLVIGWGLVGLALLGMFHIVREPDSLTDLDAGRGRRGLDRGGRRWSAAGAGGLRRRGGHPDRLVPGRHAAHHEHVVANDGIQHRSRGRFGRPPARPWGEASHLQSVDPQQRTWCRTETTRIATPERPTCTENPPRRRSTTAPRKTMRSSLAPAAPKASAKRRRKSSAHQPALPIDGQQVGEWVLPPLSHLKQAGEQAVNMAEIERRGQTLQESLSQHSVETELIGMTVGPTVTRYELELGPGVKVARITSLQKDIAYAMAATDVRILAPIPGRSAIGVEVPNHQRQLVALGDLMVSPEASEATHPLEVAIGKDIAGKSVFLDLSTTPHLLIAGATGAGKSSGINCILTSLLMRTTPDQVRLILIDPKQVEMGQYQRLPHLLTQPVTNPKKAANALGWAVKEMERRYDVLSEVGFRDITGYNAAFERGEVEPPPGVDPEDSPYEHMPYIVVVVDELNDLMMVAARDVEESITRIAQKARAVGIHLIIATQRPSVNVITGVIKANVPARMAFAVSSLTDSRVILDQPGAEKLVGKGDMLLLPGNSSIPNRIQGSFVSEDEVRKVVAHWRQQAPEPVYSTNVEGDDDAGGASAGGMQQMSLGGAFDVTSDANAFSAGDDDEDNVMMRQAMELVVRSQLGSTSMLQRKLKVGFARAGRIMDLLEQRGVVGPSEGSKAREVLMTVEEFELLQNNGQL